MFFNTGVFDMPSPDPRQGDMAEMDELQRQAETVARGALRMAFGGVFLAGLLFGCGLVVGARMWGN